MKKAFLVLLLGVGSLFAMRILRPSPALSADHPLITHAGDADFRQTVQASGEWVLVDLWAPWCGPCLRLKPILNELAPAYENRVAFLAVNVDDAAETAGFFGVRGIPCLVLMHNGTEVDRLVGLPSKGKLDAWLNSKVPDVSPSTS